MVYGLVMVLATGIVWASISAVMSDVARFRVPSYLFYSIGATMAAVLSWIFLVDWRAAMEVPARELLSAVPFFLFPGLVNVASQSVMVQTLKLGHNGLSIAIRNCAGIVPFVIGLIFLNAQVSWFNWAGLILATSGLVLITLCKSRSADHAGAKGFTVKWLLLTLLSMLLSGSFQSLNTISAAKFPTIVQLRMATPLVMTCCAIGYITALCIWQRDTLKKGAVTVQVWRYAVVWAILAVFSYYFMFEAISAMRKIDAAAIVFPMVMGLNVSGFSIYSKIKLREPYTPVNIVCLILCLTGVILLSLR